MPERLDKLRAALEDLERELSSLDSIDPETRLVLQEAKLEIEEALSHRDPSRLRIQSPTLVQRLKQAERDFEASHPTLSGIVMRMVNTLAQLGI